MDIPYDLWNETSAEVADLKKQVWWLKDLYFCTIIFLKSSYILTQFHMMLGNFA